MAIVSSNHEGYSAIYKANLATMEIGEKLFSIPGYDVGTAIPNEDRDGIVGYTYATDRVRRKFTDERLATVQKLRSEEHKSELQSLMRHSYAVFCFKKQK